MFAFSSLTITTAQRGWQEQNCRSVFFFHYVPRVGVILGAIPEPGQCAPVCKSSGQWKSREEPLDNCTKSREAGCVFATTGTSRFAQRIWKCTLVHRGAALRVPASVFRKLVLAALLLTTASCHKQQEESADAAQKKGPSQRWAFSSGVQALTGAALGPDGTIYVGASDGLLAISTEGKLRWKYPVALGLRAPAAVAPDGTLYVASSWGGFETLNPDGTRRWDSGRGMIGFNSSPTLGNGTAYLANKVSDVWALEPGKTNSLDWQIQTEREGLGFSVPTLPGSASVNQVPSTASPVIGPLGDLYVPRQHWLHGIGSDGTPGWQLFLTNSMLGPAAVGQNGILYLGDTGSSQPKLFAVNPNGSLRWQLDLPAQVVGSPVVDAKGNVFISTTTQLVAVSPDGALNWKMKLNDRCASSPTLTEDGTLYLGLDSNQLIAADTDGKQKWSLRTRGTVHWPPVISPDGVIYASTDSGEVFAVQDAGSPLMQNAWPRYQHDSQNTGRISGL